MLMSYIKKHKWLALIGPLFKLFEAILELFNPIIVAKIIDEGVKTGDMNFILRYGLIILAINVVGFGFSVIGQKCASLASAKISAEMRKDAFAKVSTFSHAELDKFGTASLVNRLTNDINQIENAIGLFMRTMLRFPFLLIGSFVLSLVINIKMSIVFLVLIPIVAIILVIYTKKTTPYFKQIRTKLDRISKVTKENLSGTRVIRAFNKQQAEQTRFEEVTDDYTKTSIKVSKISALLEPIVFLIVDAATIALLAVGGWQINLGYMSQGDIIALIDYVAMITISLLLVSQLISIFVRTVASVNRIDKIFKTEPTIKNPENGKMFKKLDYEALMEFKNVSFNYVQDPKQISFIKDLSFKIYPNQTIGIIGGTGSGKTTIANLMTRFYDATMGEVLYKGKNIKEFT